MQEVQPAQLIPVLNKEITNRERRQLLSPAQLQLARQIDGRSPLGSLCAVLGKDLTSMLKHIKEMAELEVLYLHLPDQPTPLSAPVWRALLEGRPAPTPMPNPLYDEVDLPVEPEPEHFRPDPRQAPRVKSYPSPASRPPGPPASYPRPPQPPAAHLSASRPSASRPSDAHPSVSHLPASHPPASYPPASRTPAAQMPPSVPQGRSPQPPPQLMNLPSRGPQKAPRPQRSRRKQPSQDDLPPPSLQGVPALYPPESRSPSHNIPSPSQSELPTLPPAEEFRDTSSNEAAHAHPASSSADHDPPVLELSREMEVPYPLPNSTDVQVHKEIKQMNWTDEHETLLRADAGKDHPPFPFQMESYTPYSHQALDAELPTHIGLQISDERPSQSDASENPTHVLKKSTPTKEEIEKLVSEVEKLELPKARRIVSGFYHYKSRRTPSPPTHPSKEKKK